MIKRLRWWYHSTHHSRLRLSSLPIEGARVAGTRHLTCDARSGCWLKDLRSGDRLAVVNISLSELGFTPRLSWLELSPRLAKKQNGQELFDSLGRCICILYTCAPVHYTSSCSPLLILVTSGTFSIHVNKNFFSPIKMLTKFDQMFTYKICT